MSLLTISALFEYVCYASTDNMNINLFQCGTFFIDVIIVGPRTERVKMTRVARSRRRGRGKKTRVKSRVVE